MAEKRTGAVILAAGRSAHMEGLKPMMKLGRTTMIQKEIDTLRQAGITPIVVVTGYQAEELGGISRIEGQSVSGIKNMGHHKCLIRFVLD